MSTELMEAPAVETSVAVKPTRQRTRKPAGQKKGSEEKREKVTFKILDSLDKKLAVHAAYTDENKSQIVEWALEAFLKRFVVSDREKPEASPAV